MTMAFPKGSHDSLPPPHITRDGWLRSLNVFSRVPVFGRLSPFRGALLIVTFLSVLAAYGMRWILNRELAQGLAWALFAGILILIIADFGGSASAYQTTDAYLSPDEGKAYAWLAENGNRGRLLDPGASPREQYLRAYSLSVAPTWRFAGYYDNGAPLHTWQQNAWTDQRTLLRLHNVRYALLRQAEPIAKDLGPKLEELGYRVAFASGDVLIYENPQIGGYAQLYHRAALDISGNFYQSFRALPELVWREIAMVAGNEPLRSGEVAFRNSPIDDLEVYDLLLIDDAQKETGELERLDIIEDRLVTPSDIEALPVSPRAHGVVWTRRPSYEEIYVEVRTPKPGILTVAESWYPHWRVSVDERAASVLRVNWALLGVRLEPGLHQVTFRYKRPVYVVLSYAVSLVTALILIARWIMWLAERLDRGQRLV